MRRQLKMRKPIDTVSDFPVLEVQGQEKERSDNCEKAPRGPLHG